MFFCHKPQKVLFFLDADKDDYYSLCLLVAQHYFGIIELIGVVVDTGFVLNIQDGLLLTQQWLNLLQVGTNLDKTDKGFPFSVNLYAGIPRPAYLDKRVFVDFWTTSFIAAVKDNYGIVIPNYDYSVQPFGEFTDEPVETGAPSVTELFNEMKNFKDNSVLCLTTGAPTSLGEGLVQFAFIQDKISKIYCMASNYLVPGNTPPSEYVAANIDVPNPFPEFNGEYNAYMNPNALQTICLYSNEINVNIVPLDCTQFSNLNPETINLLNAIAAPYLKLNKDPWVTNVCNYFISLLATTLVTLNSPLYLWDLCATTIALNANVDQQFILTTPIVTTTGKITQSTYGCNDKVKLYNYLSYIKLLNKSIQIIFNDPAYKA